jgi:hypothetical protein
MYPGVDQQWGHQHEDDVGVSLDLTSLSEHMDETGGTCTHVVTLPHNHHVVPTQHNL